MVDKVNVDLDEQFLKKFFAVTDRMIPDDQEITMLMLRKQLDEIETVLKEQKNEIEELKKASSQPKAPYQSNVPHAPLPFDEPTAFEEGEKFNLPKKNILIIDDLGVITYQLEVLFKQYGFDVTTSKEIYDAIEKFKKQNFDAVTMDLFIPTEREGFILLEELKKIAINKQINVKIGIMSASSKKEHKQLCKMKGAEFYVEKIDDWQKELLTVVKNLK